MTDYFIDLTADSNGDGSSTSPWNQLTTTEHTTISGGDNLWFRRCAPGIGTSLITWLAGPDNTNRINYIGWPLEGDDYYNIRDSALATTWDLDSTNYIYQRLNSSSSTVVTLVDNITIHRFLIQNTTNSYSNNFRVIDIRTKNNISIKHSYIDAPYGSTANTRYAYAKVLRIENSANILFENCYVRHLHSPNNPMWTYMYYLYNSEIYFKECTFQHGTSTTASYMNNYSVGTYSSQVVNSEVFWESCTMYFSMRPSYPNYAGDHNSAINWIKSDSFVTISGCHLNFNGSNETSDRTLPSYAPQAAFGVNGSVLKAYNNTFETINRNTSFVMAHTQSDIFIDTVVMDMDAPCAMLLDIKNYKKLTIKNITGSSYSAGTAITSMSYLLAFRTWDLLKNIQFDNIQENLGYLLDTSRTNQTPINIIEDIKLANVSKILITSAAYIKIKNSTLQGIEFYSLSANSGRYIYGGYAKYLDVELTNCTFKNIPFSLINNNDNTIKLVIKYCKGNNLKLIERHTNTFSSLEAIIKRNTGFSYMGDLNVSKDISAHTILNNFNNGATEYICNLAQYKTSPVYRTNGPGYSVEIINTKVDGLEVTYPAGEQDNTWIHLPASGTYTVKAYFAYTTESSIVGSDGDVKLSIDIINNIPEYNDTTILEEDLSSTWQNTTVSGMFTATNTINVNKAQYCPVRVHYFRNFYDTKLYFDPKLDVTLV
jgi:hypothetical protein